jgi:ATP-binding cassette subfamily B multidrug efflux pump
LESKKRSGLYTLRRILSFTKPYSFRLLSSILLAIVLAIFAPIRPYLIQESIDHYIGNHLLQGLIWISIVQIGILLLETLLRFLFMYITSWLGQTVVNDIRLKVHDKILHQNLSYFDQTPIGTLTTRTVNDIEAVNDIFSEGLISIVADVLTIIAIIIIMFYTHWQLTLVSLAVFPILIFATYVFKESVKKSFQRVRNAVSNLNAFVQEHITGMYIVQAFAAEDREVKKFNIINKEHRDANIKSIFAYSVFFPIVEIILAIAIGMLVWYGASKMLDHQVTQGIIIAFIMYLNLLFRPLRMLADKFNTLQMGMVAGERVLTVLDSEAYLKNNGTLKATTIRGDIKFEQVYFEYKPQVPVLQDISFEVKAGETLALVGRTGAGKTSIISIISRLYDIKSGAVLVDGVNITDYDVYNLRKHIGIVLQDVSLFSGSIYDNISMKDASITMEAVVAVCKDLDLHDFICQLPDNYHFNVMERGNLMSQGQRQLIAFARALIFNPSIIILDEATASIDSNTEILVQKAIEKLVFDKTAIIIAHRLSTIKKANTILVLDKGSIVEKGTHNTLLAQQGIYAQMYSSSAPD